MKEFFSNALPWITLGLALAAVAAFAFEKKKPVCSEETSEHEPEKEQSDEKAENDRPKEAADDEKEEKADFSGLSMGLCFGSAFGVIFMSMLGTNAIVYGVALGMLGGVICDNMKNR